MFKSTRKKIVISITLFTFFLTLTGIESVKAQNGGFDPSLLRQDITINNSQFESFVTRFEKMNLYEADGITPITRNGVPVVANTQRWVDPIGEYPTVAVSFSQPFLTDEVFKYLTEEQKKALYEQSSTTDNIQIKSDDNSKLYYLKQFDVAFDVGVKSVTNLGTNRPFYDIYLSPLDSMYHSHRGKDDYDSFDASGFSNNIYQEVPAAGSNLYVASGVYDINTRDGWDDVYMSQAVFDKYKTNGQLYDPNIEKVGFKELDVEPFGMLSGWVGTGSAPWSVGWVNDGSPAILYNSLEPLGHLHQYYDTAHWEYFPDRVPNALSGGNDLPDAGSQSLGNGIFQTAINNLQTKYGNKEITVKPVIRLDALSQFLKGFDYSIKTTIEGHDVTINVQTTSAKIGVYRALDAGDSYKLLGIVKNNFNQQSFKENYMGTNPEDTQTQQKTGFFPQDGPSESKTLPWQSSVTLNAKLDLIQTYPVPYPSKVDSFTSTNDLPFVTQIDIANFDKIPTSFTAQEDFVMKPFTTVEWAKYSMTSQYIFYDGTLLNNDQNERKDIQRFVEFPFKITVDNVFATRRVGFRVAVLTENQAEVVLTNGRELRIEDFNEFSYNGLGQLIDAGLKAQTTVTWDDFLQLFNNPWIMLLVVGIIVIITIIIIMAFVSRARGISAGSATGPSFFGSQSIKVMIWIIVILAIALTIAIAIAVNT